MERANSRPPSFLLKAQLCPGACDRGYFRGEGREAGEVGRWLEDPRLGKLLPRLARIGLFSCFLIGFLT